MKNHLLIFIMFLALVGFTNCSENTSIENKDEPLTIIGSINKIIQNKYGSPMTYQSFGGHFNGDTISDSAIVVNCANSPGEGLFLYDGATKNVIFSGIKSRPGVNLKLEIKNICGESQDELIVNWGAIEDQEGEIAYCSVLTTENQKLTEVFRDTAIYLPSDHNKKTFYRYIECHDQEIKVFEATELNWNLTGIEKKNNESIKNFKFNQSNFKFEF